MSPWDEAVERFAEEHGTEPHLNDRLDVWMMLEILREQLMADVDPVREEGDDEAI
jgi:hypothetical protein